MAAGHGQLALLPRRGAYSNGTVGEISVTVTTQMRAHATPTTKRRVDKFEKTRNDISRAGAVRKGTAVPTIFLRVTIPALPPALACRTLLTAAFRRKK